MTTPYNILMVPTAAVKLKTLPAKQQKNIIKSLESFAINPRPPTAHKITGMAGLYKEIIDHDFHIIYKIEDQAVLILIIKTNNDIL